MELGPFWYDLGLLGLFLACFLAATILPFSSEALFLAFLAYGYNVSEVLLVSSVGNWLGGMTSYGLGCLIPIERIPTWFGSDPAKVKRWELRIRPRGYIWALLCWLPFIGDLIAVALGSLQTKWLPTAILMFMGKALRYAALAGLFGRFLAA